MKTNPDSDHEDALLDAVLDDEGWRAANAAAKTQALGVFQARQRVRRWTRRAGGAAALALLAVCAAHWPAAPVAPARGRLVENVSAPPPAQPEKQTYLTDGQLLALFPAGSCFLAEVDGKKKLVFYDPDVEREYISAAGASRSFPP